MTKHEKTTRLTVRLSEGDRRLWERAACVEAMGVGAFVREAAGERATEVPHKRGAVSLGSHVSRLLAALDDDVPSPALRELFARNLPWSPR